VTHQREAQVLDRPARTQRTPLRHTVTCPNKCFQHTRGLQAVENAGAASARCKAPWALSALAITPMLAACGRVALEYHVQGQQKVQAYRCTGDGRWVTGMPVMASHRLPLQP
jgi:hypothetical protein